MAFRPLIASSLLGILVAAPASANEVVLAPAKDNTIYAEGAASNALGTSIFAGTNMSRSLRRALLGFNVAAAIPAGSTITAAELRVRVSAGQGGNRTAALHRLLADWGEGTSAGEPGGQGAPATPGDATWLYSFFDTVPWAAPGGDYFGTASSQQMLGDTGSFTFESTPRMAADLQAWLDDPGTNFGWMVLGDEQSPGTAKRMWSRDAPDPTNRPALVIAFDPPAASPTNTAVPPSPTPTPTPRACAGDCNGDETVAIGELIRGVNIALGIASISECPAFDLTRDGAVDIAELITAVNNALMGCPGAAAAAEERR